MTLIVYDNSGKVWNIMSGVYEVPNGIPYLEVEIPEGKRVISIDVTSTPHVPIYEDLPAPETEVLKERITYLEGVVNSMLGF